MNNSIMTLYELCFKYGQYIDAEGRITLLMSWDTYRAHKHFIPSVYNLQRAPDFILFDENQGQEMYEITFQLENTEHYLSWVRGQKS